MIRAGTADTTIKVAPLVGAWIEIQMQKLSVEVLEVAPLVGAWIEIEPLLRCSIHKEVAPLVGAWIEIKGGYIIPEPEPRRSSCRSVD